MDKSEKRFERDIESFLISPAGGYTQFKGQDAVGNWVCTREHDVAKCIYMDVLCDFIAKTQPREWAKYTKYYGAAAADKLYHRLETTISNQGVLFVLRNGIEDMGCKLKVCYFQPESDLNPVDASTEMFVRGLFPDKFRAIVTQCFMENKTSFDKLFSDPDFYQKVQEAMAQELYKALRKD